MNNSYRILEDGEFYYPQKKYHILWVCPVWLYIKNHLGKPISCYTLEEAEDVIDGEMWAEEGFD